MSALRGCRLMVITHLQRYGKSHTLSRLQQVCEDARPGSVCVQLRERQLGARELLRLAVELQELCARTGQLLAVNDRLDVAHLVEAAVVHLPEQGVPLTEARRYFEYTERMPAFSCACHDLKVLASQATSSDLLVLSPAAQARKGRAPFGLEVFRRALRFREGLQQQRNEPRGKGVFVLGGIEAGNATQWLGAGAQGVAVMGAAFAGADPRILLDALAIRR